MLKDTIIKGIKMVITFTLICGLVYTAVITGLAQLIFPEKANGSIIEIDGKKYGSELMAQYYENESHMWGRMMNIDISTFSDKDGNQLMYAAPSNLSPASEEYEKLVSERIEKIRMSNPKMGNTPIPVDLVTCSASGLDPEISPAAAEYQIPRIAEANNISEKEVKQIVKECSKGKFLGVFGEKTVNVLKVNLMLDGVV